MGGPPEGYGPKQACSKVAEGVWAKLPAGAEIGKGPMELLDLLAALPLAGGVWGEQWMQAGGLGCPPVGALGCPPVKGRGAM